MSSFSSALRSTAVSGWFPRTILLAAVMAAALQAQGGGALTCYASAQAPTLRSESVADLAGDIVITCSGGTPVASGSPVPQVDITVYFTAPVTSRLYPNGWSEAVLLVDEPGSGLPASPVQQLACNDPSGRCSVTGTGTGLGVYDGSTGRPNVFQGSLVGGSQITFAAVPFAPPDPGSSRILRITNVRVNAATVGSANPVQAYVSTGSLPLSNSTVTVGNVQNALQPCLRTPDDSSVGSGFAVNQCIAGAQRVGVLRFSELYASAFRARTTASFVDANTSPAPQSQNIPGQMVSSESGFYAPALTSPVADFSSVGLASAGTRLRATIANVPAGTSLFVSTVGVTFTGGVPAANLIGRSVARLTQVEAQPFAAVASTATLEGIPAAQLQVVNGTATAVWELLATNASALENMDFLVWIAPGGSSLSASTETASFAPLSPDTGGSASDTLPLPRFEVGTLSSVTGLFAVSPCSVSFSTTSLPDGWLGQHYHQTLAASGGVTPYSFSVTGGTSPVSLSAAGVLDGAMAAAGDFSFVVTVTDHAGAQDIRAFSIHVAATAPPAALSIYMSHSGNFMQGQTGATYAVTVSNAASAGPTNSKVTVTVTPPSGLTLVSMSGGATWNCTAPPICTASSILSGGASYPPITVNVHVAANATSPQVNQVAVSGGGSADASITDSTVILPLQVTKVGTYSVGLWQLDVNGNGVFDSGIDKSFALGWAGATIVTGDWNGDGRTKVGVYSNGYWFLDYDGNGVWDGGVNDKLIAWGWPGATPMVGDWNGDGKTKIGVYSNGFWFLDYDGNYIWDGGVVDKQVGCGWCR